jgi:hypothetical protein
VWEDSRISSAHGQMFRNHNSSVGIAKGRVWKTGIRFPAGPRDFYLYHCVQTGFGATQHIMQYVRGRFPPGVKRSGRENDHLPPSSVDIKNGEAIPPLPPNIFMERYLIN